MHMTSHVTKKLLVSVVCIGQFGCQNTAVTQRNKLRFRSRSL